MYLPDIFKTFRDQHSDILDAQQKVGELCSAAGPLGEKDQHLVQLGVSIGAEARGAVKSHARRALDAGASREEVLQVVLLSLPTIGFPSMIAAYGWVEDVLEARDES